MPPPPAHDCGTAETGMVPDSNIYQTVICVEISCLGPFRAPCWGNMACKKRVEFRGLCLPRCASIPENKVSPPSAGLSVAAWLRLSTTGPFTDTHGSADLEDANACRANGFWLHPPAKRVQAFLRLAYLLHGMICIPHPLGLQHHLTKLQYHLKASPRHFKLGNKFLQ